MELRFYTERMDKLTIVYDIERRARAQGLRMKALCNLAGISPSTPSRWKSGADAKLATIKLLTDELEKLEANT